jgi:ABC-type branched-subunit amino acid transport system substrate-binding protein
MIRGILTGSALAAGLAIASVSASADTVNLTIGKLLEVTGPLSETGPSQDKAVKLAVEYANEQAKKAGVAIQAKDVGADVQGDPQAAVSAARSLVDQGASCLIGPAITPESIAIANGVTIQKRVTIWPVGTSMRLRTIKDEGTIFRTVPPDSLQALALVNAAIDKLGTANGKLASVIYRNEPYGEGLAKDFSAAWTAKGGKVQGPTVFDPAQATFDSEAGQAVANNPDAYIIIDYPDTYAKLGAALVRTGKFDPTKALVADALAFSTVPSNIPPQAIEGMRGTRGGTPTGTDAYKIFVAEGGRRRAFLPGRQQLRLRDAVLPGRSCRQVLQPGRSHRPRAGSNDQGCAEILSHDFGRCAQGGRFRPEDRLHRRGWCLRIRGQRRSDRESVRHLRVPEGQARGAETDRCDQVTGSLD